MAITMEGSGKWLYASRKAAGLTQGELARKAQISTSYVSTLEREEPHHITNASPRPAVSIVDAIAKAVNKPVNEARLIFGYAPIGEETNEGLFAGIERLSPEMQRVAKRQIRAIIDSLSAQDEHETDYIDT